MNKRLALAQVLLFTGFGFLNKYKLRDTLLIFNYHRIRPDDTNSPINFDDRVYGPTQSQFKKQIEYLKKYTTLLSEDDLIHILQGGSFDKGPYTLITFDDGYIDNYTLAAPILIELNASAIFFIPVNNIENRTLGWWDKIAFIIKNSPLERFYFRDKIYSTKESQHLVIQSLFEMMYSLPSEETSNLVEELAQCAHSPDITPESMDKELMTWEQITQLSNTCISIGSHTCSHRVLSTLNQVEQEYEIYESKKFLEKKLQSSIHSIAYPVGGPSHFTDITKNIAQKAGYTLAFSFNTGFQKITEVDNYAIRRFGAPESPDMLKATIHFPSLMDYSKNLFK